MLQNRIITTSIFVIGIAMMPIDNLFANNELYIDPNGGLSDSQVTDYAAPKASYSADGKTIVVDGQTSIAPSSVAQPIDDRNEMDKASDAYQAPTNTKGPIKVYTSEMIPGAQCTCEVQGQMAGDGMGPPTPTITSDGVCPSSVPVAKRKYVCIVQPGLGSFQTMFASIIRYFVNIVLILGVLAIVGLGIAWSLAGGDDAKAKSSLKKWGINIVVGLIILFMFQYILKFLAPWIYQ